MTRNIRLDRWTDLNVRIGAVDGELTYHDPHSGTTTDFEYGTWISPAVTLDFPATELIPSWIARTPPGTWIQVQARITTPSGHRSGWYILGRWAEDHLTIRRTSVPGQDDGIARVDTDTLACAADVAMAGWQLRVIMHRRPGSPDSPRLISCGAAASRVVADDAVLASAPVAPAAVRALPVPRFAQHPHAGQNPEWDGGGGSWCSPASVAMAAAYWGAGASRADLAGFPYADPWVNAAAGGTYDHGYRGCGNWPFSAAYAGRLGLDGFVTRLRSLTEVERFIAAGIPLVLSVSYRAGEVPGADYDTNGHLLVVVGFTASGDPVLNDPAAADNAGVRKVFGRTAFERAWLGRSGGVAYVIRPLNHPLPPAPPQPNW